MDYASWRYRYFGIDGVPLSFKEVSFSYSSGKGRTDLVLLDHSLVLVEAKVILSSRELQKKIRSLQGILIEQLYRAYGFYKSEFGVNARCFGIYRGARRHRGFDIFEADTSRF